MSDGRTGEAEIVYRSLFSIFDDFDIADDGFVIANNSVRHSNCH